MGVAPGLAQEKVELSKLTNVLLCEARPFKSNECGESKTRFATAETNAKAAFKAASHHTPFRKLTEKPL